MIDLIHIYTLSDPRTGEVRYVGRTNQPKIRFNNHLYSDRGANHKWAWIKSLKSENLKPVMEIIESVPAAKAIESEKIWIESFRFYGCRLTNSDFGSIGALSVDAKLRAKASTEARGGYAVPRERVSKMLKTRRENGSQQGEKHPNSKLTNEQARQIRSLAGTMKNTEISRMFGIDPSTVGKIIKGKAWVAAV